MPYGGVDNRHCRVWSATITNAVALLRSPPRVFGGGAEHVVLLRVLQDVGVTKYRPVRVLDVRERGARWDSQRGL